jgi:thiamine transport system ATP-binding protein
VVALLGSSGCGKTTVLRAVAGLEAVAAGNVLVDGVDVTSVPAHRRGVGLMFQDLALFPHRDVGANVEFGLRMHGVAADDRRRRVAEVLGLVDLVGWERRSVAELSGGEQQRVALARALAPEPGVLLLDEPMGSLDRSLRDRLIPELSALFRRLGTTVVYVTHDQTEAMGLADRVAVMEAGRFVQVATPAQVWAHPETATVARLLGFTNVFDAATFEALGLGPAPGGALVRPEAVRLDRSGEWRGEVVAVVFRGDHSLVTVRLDAGPELDAAVPTADPDVTPGGVVGLSFDEAGVVRFPAAPTS